MRRRRRAGGEDPGLRRLEAADRERPDAGRPDRRDAAVPRARAGRRQGGAADRPVRDRRDALRVSHEVLPYQNHASFGLLRAIVLGKFPTPRALRPELPEKLEEIILRAMRTAPEQRFESVHALGRELLPFGSAHAREKWRAYYLDERLKAPPKASTHAMPLIEAMARGYRRRRRRAIRRASRRQRWPNRSSRRDRSRRCPHRWGRRHRRPPTASRVSAVPTASESIAKTARPTRWPLWGLVLALALGWRPPGGSCRDDRPARRHRTSSFRSRQRHARPRQRRQSRRRPARPRRPQSSRRRPAMPRPQRSLRPAPPAHAGTRTDARNGRRCPNGPPTAFRSCRELDTLADAPYRPAHVSASTGGGLDRGRDRFPISAGTRGRG